jgi:hypothetical protein
VSNPTSAVIRGLNNAYPISTMRAYGTNWVDADFELFKKTINDEISQIKQDLPEFLKLKVGNYRIGQGGLKAKLPQQHQEYLDNKLKEIGIDNTGDTPKIIDDVILKNKENDISLQEDAQIDVVLKNKQDLKDSWELIKDIAAEDGIEFDDIDMLSDKRIKELIVEFCSKLKVKFGR